MPRHQADEYDATYGARDGERPPWEIGQVQPALAAVVEYGHGLTDERLEQLFAERFADVRIAPTTIHAHGNRPLSMPGWLLRATAR